MDPITIELGYADAIVRGELPKPESKTLLIIGMCDIEANLANAKAFKDKNDCDVVTCNEAAEHYTGAIDYMASMHTSLLPGWFKGRKYKKAKPVTVGSKPADGVDISMAFNKPIGSSAMLAMLFGKAAGYERIVLCGVDLRGESYARARGYWKAAKAQGHMEGVEALTGGWVAQLLAGRV